MTNEIEARKKMIQEINNLFENVRIRRSVYNPETYQKRKELELIKHKNNCYLGLECPLIKELKVKELNIMRWGE